MSNVINFEEARARRRKRAFLAYARRFFSSRGFTVTDADDELLLHGSLEELLARFAPDVDPAQLPDDIA